MGRNFISCCHRCKKKVFHLRSKESITLHAFYEQHEACMRINPKNVETLDDQLQEADWMSDDSDYTDEFEWVEQEVIPGHYKLPEDYQAWGDEVFGVTKKEEHD